MPKLVQKSGYIKAGKAGGYMNYIATRENVEKLDGNGPATQNQQQLIQNLVRDFPDTKDAHEYEDYESAPTFGNASALITTALERNMDETQGREQYLKYMATRPRVERHGEHGLFSSAPSVSLNAALKELEEHDGNVYTFIYSLRREDAERLGYDNAEAWRDGLCAPPWDEEAEKWFRVAAKRGNNVAQYALGKMLIEQDELREGVDWLAEAADNGNSFARYRLGKMGLTGDGIIDGVERAIIDLTDAAEQGNRYAQYTLGKVYLQGYEVGQNMELAEYWLSKAADQGNAYAQFFLDHMNEQRKPTVMLSVSRLLYHLGNIFRDNEPSEAAPGTLQIDHKRRQEMLDKRIAMGHKPDDHEDQQYSGMSMATPW